MIFKNKPKNGDFIVATLNQARKLVHQLTITSKIKLLSELENELIAANPILIQERWHIIKVFIKLRRVFLKKRWESGLTIKMSGDFSLWR